MILIVNGFGAGVEYMNGFAKHLALDIPIKVVSLLHGVSFEKECDRVNALVCHTPPSVVMAFSTGCTVISACDLPQDCRIVLINPPDISPRKSLCSALRFLMTTKGPMIYLGHVWNGSSMGRGSLSDGPALPLVLRSAGKRAARRRDCPYRDCQAFQRHGHYAVYMLDETRYHAYDKSG